MSKLNAPFAYFGGKRKIAAEVWRRFGDVRVYVEPFCGSAAVLLRRPDRHKPKIEIVNDIECMIANFWRAVQHAPEEVAQHADWPVLHTDLTARHVWLMERKPSMRGKLEGDPDWYDAKIAGWWVWGINAWIGWGWCAENASGPWSVVDGEMVDTRKNGTRKKGVKRKIPHVMNGVGRIRNLPRVTCSNGVQRHLPHARNSKGIHQLSTGIEDWMFTLQARLRNVRVLCDDWRKSVSDAVVLPPGGKVGVFLDPPYAGERYLTYAHDQDAHTVFEDAADWAREHGDSDIRIALCGYDGTWEPPKGWATFRWKASGGYSSRGKKGSRGRNNAERETVWFSPACKIPESARLY